MTETRIENLSNQQYKKAIKGQGLTLEIGPFSVNVTIKFPNIAHEFRELYAPYVGHLQETIVDGHMRVGPSSFLRRWFRPQVNVDYGYPDEFLPLGADIGMVALEMGLNWGVVMGCRHYLFLHAGVVEKDGNIIVLPGSSGSGKSTLSAGLAFAGWRIFSDEFGLIDVRSGEFLPYPRPISLKNRSIDVMRDIVGEKSTFSKNYYDTPKGTLAYLVPPREAIVRDQERAKARKIIFPKFEAGKPAQKEALTKTMGFFRLVKSSANYGIIGEDAFRTIGRIIDECDMFDISFPSMEEGMRLVNEIIDNDEKSLPGTITAGGGQSD